MNYVQLQQLIQDYAENTEALFVKDIPQFVQQAETRIYNSVNVPSLRKNVVGTMTSGNQYVALPIDWLANYSFAVIDPTTGMYNYLINKDVNFMRQAYPYATNKYYWSFGDGLAASTLNTSHIYAKEGSYNIKQIVTSSDNSCVDSISQTITVTKCTADGISEPDSVNIYPNPNNGIFKVKFLSIVQRNAKVAVIGASTGIIFMIKDIQAIEGRNTINIDMTAPVFKPGVYIIRIIGDNISYTPQRFVLIK